MDARLKNVCDALSLKPSLSVPALAGIANLSQSRLHHLFKEQTGMSMRAYARELQLQHARQLLEETQRPIKDICWSSGIPDISNFVRYFKKRFRMTPAAYRERMRHSA